MRPRTVRRSTARALAALLVPAALLVVPPRARAGDADQAKKIELLEKQLRMMQRQIDELKAAQAKSAAAARAEASRVTAGSPVAAAKRAGAGAGAPVAAASGEGATQPASVKAEPVLAPNVVTTRNGGLQIGSVNVKPGGFIEAAGIYRTRNEVADVGSDYNQGIPFKSSPLAHENETRFSARQSRLSLLTSADVNPETHLGAYYEMDFLSSGTNSNSRESFSYTPRIRQGYATLDRDDLGFHLLAGQAWSLLTTNTRGIVPRMEQIPLTIDAQYVEGFNWLRVPQFRAVEDFGRGLWLGVSAESPQIVTSPITAPSQGVNYTNNGNSAGLLNNSTTYSNDYVPDFIGKVALDPGFGHYELKGLFRTFTVHSGGTNRSTFGWGGGAAASLPVVPQYLDLQLSGLYGSGIGRYGSGQLPDAAFKADLLHLVAVPEAQALVGLIGHPFVGTDLYAYGGWEHADSAGAKGVFTDPSTGKFAGAPGYGSPELITSGCDVEGGTCQAETEDLTQVTAGFWQDIYKGSFGRFVFGGEGGYIWRKGFTGVGGTPRTNIGIFMTSLRYYPFL